MDFFLLYKKQLNDIKIILVENARYKNQDLVVLYI